ncbi:MAG: MFS transporter [Chloroflexi bacterium]|nr:MFS transporter [Chloroflexota bacterium]
MSDPENAAISPFSVLAHSQYRLLLIGTTLAMVAFGMMNVVQGVVAFDLTGKSSAVGFVSLGQGVAMLFLSPIGGAMSDRISKRRLLLFTQAAIGIMYGAIAVLIATDVLTIWILAACTLVLGCLYAVMGPTRQSWIGDLLAGPALAHGVALQQLMQNATRIVGPLLAGALLGASFVGSGGVYLVMAAIFACVVAVLALMQPTPPVPRAAPASIFGDLGEGVRYVASNADLRLLTLVFGGVVLSAFSYQTVMPGYLENQLRHPASQLGLIYGAAAIGGIVTTLFIATHPPRRPAWLMLACGAGLGGSLLLLAIAPSFMTAMVVAVLVGATSSGFQMLNNVTLMQRTSPRFFGRVMAVTMMAFGLNAIVAYPVGAIADRFGERQAMAGMAGVTLLVVLYGVIANARLAPRPRTLTAAEQ